MQKFLQYVNPYDKIWKLLLVTLGIALFVTILFWGEWYASFTAFIKAIFWSYTITLTQWIGHVYINNKLEERISWRDNAVKRSILGTLFIIGYAVIAFLLVQMLMFLIFYGRLPQNHNWALRSSIYVILVSSGVSLFFTARGFFKAWKKSLLEAEAIKREMLVYKYESLQNQINPHFLFNSFNVLSDLVYQDQDKAVFFIKKLSKLFRYVLDSREKELVPINEELNFIKSFTYLLQTRFEDKLNINIQVPAQSNEMVVPMALQLLLENCIKHNEISKQHPLHINISRIGNFIEVKNNLQLKYVGPDSNKIGLQNLKQQYKFFTHEEIVVQQDDTNFIVKIPILNM